MSATDITLGEGNTPLVRSRRIGPSIGAPGLFFKLETVNPTGSYKDRFARAAIADMLSRGCTRCIATSSGNTGSALAAYCASAGLKCEIAIVETAPIEKLKQMMVYGARIYRVRGFGTSADVTKNVLERIRRKGAQPGNALQISAFCCSPAGMNGVKSIGHELSKQLPGSAAHVFVPAGGGGLTLAIARGLAESRSPARVNCVQPEGNDTIASMLRTGKTRAREVVCTTKISGLQVASVLDGDDVIAACRASSGTGYLVTDDDVFTAQARLAREEGVFCEPAGAVALAGAIRAVESSEVDPNSSICCIVTGVGFKDAPSVDRMLGSNACPMIEPSDV